MLSAQGESPGCKFFPHVKQSDQHRSESTLDENAREPEGCTKKNRGHPTVAPILILLED